MNNIVYISYNNVYNGVNMIISNVKVAACFFS